MKEGRNGLTLGEEMGTVRPSVNASFPASLMTLLNLDDVFIDPLEHFFLNLTYPYISKIKVIVNSFSHIIGCFLRRLDVDS